MTPSYSEDSQASLSMAAAVAAPSSRSTRVSKAVPARITIIIVKTATLEL